ncbi:hypothetical protein NL393_37625, partial [Klebsiella pneumoniae]|nr:hypothetical protein [Klebsiella pneumoniae]
NCGVGHCFRENHLWFTYHIRPSFAVYSIVKCGPGFSGRSHMADEFLYVDEIRQGIEGYIAMLKPVVGLN